MGGPPRQLRPCSPPAPGGVRLPPRPVHPTPRGHVGIPKEIKRLLNTDLTHLSVCVKCGYVGMAHNIRGWGPTATGQPASRAVASATPAPPPGVGRTGRTCRFPGPTQGCSQILMPWPMGRPLTTAPVTCHQTEAGLWHCHAPVQAPGQQKCPAPTRGSAVLSGVQGMRGCGISPVGHGGHNTGSQNAELALISPRKVSGPNLSDLYHVEGGGLVCRIRGPFTQDPSIGKALKHTYFILLGVHSNVKPGWHLEDLCVCVGGDKL